MTLFVVAPDESLTNGWKLLEQGPESQSASGACSGGVSAVMGSSDLDALTLFSDATGRQSAVVLIAFWGLHDPSWRWRASPGLSSIPVQGEPQGSWIGISALHTVALMGRKQ